eukprot:6211172-Pleurochrysis_carterae.AAC.2
MSWPLRVSFLQAAGARCICSRKSDKEGGQAQDKPITPTAGLHVCASTAKLHLMDSCDDLPSSV